MSYLNTLLVSACLLFIQDQLGGGTTGQAPAIQYIVQPDETLQVIAQKLCGTAVPWTQIRDLNGLSGETVTPGSALIIPPQCPVTLRIISTLVRAIPLEPVDIPRVRPEEAPRIDNDIDALQQPSAIRIARPVEVVRVQDDIDDLQQPVLISDIPRIGPVGVVGIPDDIETPQQPVDIPRVRPEEAPMIDNDIDALQQPVLLGFIPRVRPVGVVGIPDDIETPQQPVDRPEMVRAETGVPIRLEDPAIAIARVDG
jgi:hypothetical protein